MARDQEKSSSPPSTKSGLASQYPESSRLHGAVEDIVIACFVLTIPMLVLTVVFLVLVYSHRVPLTSEAIGSAYYVNYSATRLITISSWTSTATSIIMPFAIVLLSYPVARSYLVHSSPARSHSLPSPYQLSLVVGMLGGSIGALWQCLLYSFWRKRPTFANMVSLVAAGLTFFLLLGLGILGADTWLHVTTTTVPYGIVQAREPARSQFGRGLYPGCFHSASDLAIYDVCLKRVGVSGQAGGITNADEAYRTLANLSTINQVRSSTVDGNTLVHITDVRSGTDMDYRASTFALNTKCRPISRECHLRQESNCPYEDCTGQDIGTAYDSGSWDFGSSYGVLSNVGFFLQFFNDSQFRDLHSSDDHSYENPLHFVAGALVIAGAQLTTDPDAVQFSTNNSTGFLFGCTSTGHDLTYQFTNGSTTGGESKKTNSTLTDSLGWVMSDCTARITFQPYLESAMIAGAQQSNTSQGMADYFARSFSEVAVGLTAGIMSPRPTLQEELRKNVLVARVPKAPFFTLLMLNLSYAVLGLSLGIWALLSHPRHARNVQARLTIPGLVANLLEPESRPQKGLGVEGLFAERTSNQVGGAEKRVAIEQLDECRWSFQLLPDRPSLPAKESMAEVAEDATRRGSPELPPIPQTRPLLFENIAEGRASEDRGDAASVRSEVSALTEEELGPQSPRI